MVARKVPELSLRLEPIDPSPTRCTRKPAGCGKFKTFAKSPVINTPSMPHQNGRRSSRKRFAVFEAVANASPSEPPEWLIRLLTIPTTSPSKLNIGLPELPPFTAASVCKNSTELELSSFQLRQCRPLRCPAVRV